MCNLYCSNVNKVQFTLRTADYHKSHIWLRGLHNAHTQHRLRVKEEILSQHIIPN